MSLVWVIEFVNSVFFASSASSFFCISWKWVPLFEPSQLQMHFVESFSIVHRRECKNICMRIRKILWSNKFNCDFILLNCEFIRIVSTNANFVLNMKFTMLKMNVDFHCNVCLFVSCACCLCTMRYQMVIRTENNKFARFYLAAAKVCVGFLYAKIIKYTSERKIVCFHCWQ